MKEFIEKTMDKAEEKIKVTSLEIIVTGTKDKPYFEIKYKEVGKEDYSIGYSSYDLNNVFDWKEKCFEIVNELAEEHNGGWIPCENELPKLEGRYLCSYNYKDGGINYVQVLSYYANDEKPHFQHEGYQGLEVVAWKPLPKPYNPKGE